MVNTINYILQLVSFSIMWLNTYYVPCIRANINFTLTYLDETLDRRRADLRRPNSSPDQRTTTKYNIKVTFETSTVPNINKGNSKRKFLDAGIKKNLENMKTPFAFCHVPLSIKPRLDPKFSTYPLV